MKKVRFGVVGTNFISDWVIAGGREDGRYELAAVCSRSRETGQAFAARHAIPHVFTSVEEMAESGCIDAVHIASPNSCHAAQSIACMERGVHVLCEKAFASNAAEARSMIETSQRCNVALMEAMKPTLTPAFQAVRTAVQKIGVLRQYFACYCQYSSRYDKLKEGVVLNAFKPELSNGALMDIGVYTIYPMVVLFGKPQTVQACGVMLPSGVDGHGSAVFGYPNGLTATVIYSKIADSRLPTEIHGEDGLVSLDRINIIGAVTLKLRKGEECNIMPATPHNEYFYEISEFIDLIEQGRLESETNTHANSLITMQILDEIRMQVGGLKR